MRGASKYRQCFVDPAKPRSFPSQARGRRRRCDTTNIMGVSPRFAYLEYDGPIAFAHRGGIAAGGAGENTMAAFQRAVDLGFRYLETDVHATADGVVLVFHDARLERLTGTAGRLAAATYASLRRLRVAGSHAIPRLDEVLAAFPEVRLNIDVKAATAIGPLLDVLRDTRYDLEALRSAFMQHGRWSPTRGSP
jgi:glycerophosphoryl diester phosphodiesterase